MHQKEKRKLSLGDLRDGDSGALSNSAQGPMSSSEHTWHRNAKNNHMIVLGDNIVLGIELDYLLSQGKYSTLWAIF